MTGSARRVRGPVAGLLGLAVLLTACSSYVGGGGVMTGTAVAPDRETQVPLGNGSMLTIGSGAVSDPGVVVVRELGPPDGVPVGLSPSGPVVQITLRGTTVVAPFQLSMVAPPTGAGPDTALLGRLDTDSGWVPVRSVYGGDPARLVADVDGPGIFSAFRIDTEQLRVISRGLLAEVLSDDVGADAPVCEGNPAANRITTEMSEDGPVLSCVGVAAGAPAVLVVDHRASFLALDVPVKWGVERFGAADPVRRAVLDTVAGVPLRKRDVKEGRAEVLLGPGLGLRLTNPPGKKGTLRITPNPRATVATGVSYAADVLITLTRELPWISDTPDPEATAELIRAALPADDCSVSLTKLARQPTGNPEQIGRLFRDATELGIGCLNRTWVAGLGRKDPADPLALTLGWLQSQIDLVFDGPVIGPALDFPLFKIMVTQTPV